MSLKSALPIALAIGCTSKPTPIADTGADTAVDTADSGAPDVTPVWEDLRLETSDTLTDAYASGSGLFVVTEQGDSWVRQSGEWTQLAVEVEGEALNGMWGTGAGETLQMVAAGDAGYLATWSDGAWSVEDLGTPNFEAVAGASADNLLAVSWGGIYRNHDGAWAYEAVDGAPRFNDVWFNGSLAFGVGEEGTIGAMNNGSWNIIQHESRRRLYAVSATSGNDAWAVGERGTVLHYDGSTWSEVDVGTTVGLWDVAAVGSSDVYIVGNNGTALHYDGIEWTELPTGVDNILYAINVSSTGTVWAVGNRGMTLRYTP